MATDCRDVLVGDIRHDENLGIATANPMIVQMAVEHVILDILHLAQLKAGIGDLAEHISNGEDYLRVIEDQHEKLNLRGAVLPTPVPLPPD